MRVGGLTDVAGRGLMSVIGCLQNLRDDSVHVRAAVISVNEGVS